MRYSLLLIALLLPTTVFAQGPIRFQVTFNEREATVHYSGTLNAPLGIGSYSTRNGMWGPKVAIRSFYKDNVTISRIGLQRQESGIRVVLPGSDPIAVIPVDAEFSRGFNEVTDSRSYKRDFTVGATRTLDGEYAGLSFFLESGVTVSRNYQAGRVGGVKLWRKHPKGHHTWHPNVGLGVLLKLHEHVSVQAGYNYTHGEIPSSHDVQFGIGFTDFR